MLLKRTHSCGELNRNNIGDSVVLNGWVHRQRDLGGLIFIDLRDRYGITQAVVEPSDEASATSATSSSASPSSNATQNVKLQEVASHLRSETVVGIRGIVRERESKNPELPTGDIEVVAQEIIVYSKAETPPFEIKPDVNVSEDLRLRYRYLDLRRPELQHNLLLRSQVSLAIRAYYQQHEFVEVETPVLMKSTPEGARDYLVPSRVNPGRFYALPQSPQTYKQLLMVSGFDRYVQIVKCFRDEDLRADRQPEFTQVDVEMSFVDEEDIYNLHEGLMKTLWKQFLNVDLPIPFPRMSYQEAMSRYGSDKPDLRFGLQIQDLSESVKGSGFKLFDDNVATGGKVLGIVVPGQGGIGRGALDRFIDKVKASTGVPGVIHMRWSEEGIQSSVGKFLSDDTHQAMAGAAQAGQGDLVLILVGQTPALYNSMGAMRLLAAEEWGLLPSKDHWSFLWVTEFPLVEWDEEEKRYFALHHPFTSPRPEDEELFQTAPQTIRARAYDLVLNGSEIGGGSIRIHRQDMQRKMFHLLGIGDEEAEMKFGFLLKAFTYGPPPHGGIALGLDRILMMMTGAPSIRDVIAFPKNQRAQSLMDMSPDRVAPKQLEELHIELNATAKKALEDEEGS